VTVLLSTKLVELLVSTSGVVSVSGTFVVVEVDDGIVDAVNELSIELEASALVVDIEIEVEASVLLSVVLSSLAMVEAGVVGVLPGDVEEATIDVEDSVLCVDVLPKDVEEVTMETSAGVEVL
jgi:hypothetical protein